MTARRGRYSRLSDLVLKVQLFSTFPPQQRLHFPSGPTANDVTGGGASTATCRPRCRGLGRGRIRPGRSDLEKHRKSSERKGGGVFTGGTAGQPRQQLPRSFPPLLPKVSAEHANVTGRVFTRGGRGGGHHGLTVDVRLHVGRSVRLAAPPVDGGAGGQHAGVRGRVGALEEQQRF